MTVAVGPVCEALIVGSVVGFDALLSMGLIWFLLPWLVRYAIARPNTRSSHHRPTPQGGGVAVVVATLAVTWGAILLSPAFLQNQQFLAVTAAAALLAVVGAIDDIRT